MKSAFRKLALVTGLGLSAAVGGAVATNAVSTYAFARAEREVATARTALEGATELSNAFKQVSRAVEPSVVQIRTQSAVATGLNLRRIFPFGAPDGATPRLPNGQPFPALPDMPELPDDGQQFYSQGTGSGVIMEVNGSEAFIVTNAHVVATANSIIITLADGREVKDAKVVGTDPRTDLAVVKVRADRLIPAKWGDSAALEKGDWVVAFGSPFGYVGSMTHGIVSALNRQVGILGNLGYEDFIQTDAPINPGNSGGPLVNLRGEVIGINSAILSRTGSFSGIGLAIPANLAKPVYDRLKTDGKMSRGWLGVSIADVANPPDNLKATLESLNFKGDSGVYVDNILRDSPAQNSLQPGDVITAINGKPVKNVRELREQIAMTAPGTEVTFAVTREGKPAEQKVKLGEQPDDPQLASMNSPLRNRIAPKTDDKLGLTLRPLTPPLAREYGLEDADSGALVTQVRPNSPLARAGLRPGDIITRIDGQQVTSPDEATAALKSADLSKGLRLHITNREGSKLIHIREN